MGMTCMWCGSAIFWKGPLSALTHTECEGCGATNSQAQEIDDQDDDETED